MVYAKQVFRWAFGGHLGFVIPQQHCNWLNMMEDIADHRFGSHIDGHLWICNHMIPHYSCNWFNEIAGPPKPMI